MSREGSRSEGRTVAVFFSIGSFRKNCEDAVHCVELAEGVKRAIESAGEGSELAHALDQGLHDAFRRFRVGLKVKYTYTGNEIGWKEFFGTHPSLEPLVAAFDEAVNGFTAHIVANVTGAR